MIATAILMLAPWVQSGSGVAVFQGFPGQPGDLVQLDTTGFLPAQPVPGLADVVLLEIDFNGNTELQRFLPDRPRLELRDPGIVWLSLPRGNGSLYRFSRAEVEGGVTFGLLWIDPAGDVHSVFELAGTGPLGDVDSFAERLAVAPAGDSVLVATTPAAGGDLYEVGLASGQTVNRTGTLAPLTFGNAGLALAESWGVAATSDRLLRFDRGAAGSAEEVSFGPGGAPAWFAGELALSPSGLFAITVAGSAPTLADAWVIGPTGDARRASQTAAHISVAGFLPEALHGPYLAVSDDGARAAWRTEGATREAFMAIVPPPATPPAVASHVTSDSLYLDTLDEIGEFLFRPLSGLLHIAVGELSQTGAGGIESLDLYEINLPSQASPGLANLTLTNGLASPPFFVKSTLSPEDGVFAFADGSVLIHGAQSGAEGELLRSPPGQAGLEVLIADVKELDLIEAVGLQTFAVVRRATGNKDREVWLIPPPGQGSAVLVMSMPDGETIVRPTVRSDGYVGFVQTLASKERLWLLDVNSLSLRKVRKFFYGPTLTFAPTGELCFSVGAVGTSAIQAALPIVGPPFRLKAPVVPGFLLPGAAY